MDQGTPSYGSNPALQQNMGLRQPNPGCLAPEQEPMQVPPLLQQAIGGKNPSHIGPGPNIGARQLETSNDNSGAEGNSPGVSSIHKPALQQLLATLKSPNTPEQQDQILQILKTNPQLLVAFIKQRQEYLKSWTQNQANSNQDPVGDMDLIQQQHLLRRLSLGETLQQALGEDACADC